jgi:membrane protein
MAAAIAYHVLFSFIPLVTVLLAAIGFVMRDPSQQQYAVDRVVAGLSLQSGTLVSDSIHSLSVQTRALTVVGLVGLFWAASGLFGSLRTALNIAWDVQEKRGFIIDKLFDLGAVLGLGILLGLSLAGTMMIHLLQTMSLGGTGTVMAGSMQKMLVVAGLVAPAALSFLAFMLLYRYVPNVRHSVGAVWPGALVAMVLFELAKNGFAFYVSHFNNYQALYGALGAVMLLMLWTYLSAIILLIGAEVASEYESMTRGRPLDGESVLLSHGHPEIAGR